MASRDHLQWVEDIETATYLVRESKFYKKIEELP